MGLYYAERYVLSRSIATKVKIKNKCVMAFLHYKKTNSKYIPCKLKRKTRITFMYLIRNWLINKHSQISISRNKICTILIMMSQ